MVGPLVWYGIGGMAWQHHWEAFVAQAINDGEPGDGEVRGKD